jgi:hemerythrin superfamily protein
MDAIELLKKQHREVEELFEKFEKTGDGAVKTRMQLFTRIADNFAAHAVIEEKLFYPSVYVGPTEDKLREAVEEHLSAKRVIADLLDLEPSDEQFKAKMKVLQELVEHHVEEEEESLFPSVRKLLSKQELDAMGEQMEEMFSELLQGEPRLEIPNETDSAPPLA